MARGSSPSSLVGAAREAGRGQSLLLAATTDRQVEKDSRSPSPQHVDEILGRGGLSRPVNRVTRAVGTLLAVIGGLLLLLVVVWQAYSVYMTEYYNRLAYASAARSAVVATTVPSTERPVSPIEGSELLSATPETPSTSPAVGVIQTSAIPTPRPIKNPPAARLVIPRIKVDSPVIEMGVKKDKNDKWAWAVPLNEVGHYENTANPGEIGNVAMAGHISIPQTLESKVFKRLPEVVPGDEVQVFNLYGEEFRYVVTGTRVVLPTEISVLDPTPDETLTLMTCVPDWIYSHRLIVTAKLALPPPGGWE